MHLPALNLGNVGQTLERILPLPNLIMAFGRLSVALVIQWIFGVFSCFQFHTLSRKNFIITWLCTEIKVIGICFFSFFLLFYLFLEAFCLNLWRKMKLLYHFDFILWLIQWGIVVLLLKVHLFSFLHAMSFKLRSKQLVNEIVLVLMSS